jgi:hypothetical protein
MSTLFPPARNSPMRPIVNWCRAPRKVHAAYVIRTPSQPASGRRGSVSSSVEQRRAADGVRSEKQALGGLACPASPNALRRPHAVLTRSRPACLACSQPATYDAPRPSAWLQPSERARSPYGSSEPSSPTNGWMSPTQPGVELEDQSANIGLADPWRPVIETRMQIRGDESEPSPPPKPTAVPARCGVDGV